MRPVESLKILKNSTNSTNLFFCYKSKSFINIVHVCDGGYDCLFWEDEENCVIENHEKFYCNPIENFSVNYKFVCNHIIDCPNKQDEEYCGRE